MPDDSPADMIMVSSIVSQATREGIVQVQWGAKACQFSVASARQLGIQLLECAEAAETDAAIFHIFTEKVKAEEHVAYGILQDIRDYREEQFIKRKAEK